MSAGVPVGAIKPYQLLASKPVRPASATVGTLGNAALRLTPATASARRRPASMVERAVDRPAK